jgi:hypothetical protein
MATPYVTILMGHKSVSLPEGHAQRHADKERTTYRVFNHVSSDRIQVPRDYNPDTDRIVVGLGKTEGKIDDAAIPLEDILVEEGDVEVMFEDTTVKVHTEHKAGELPWLYVS